MTGWIIVTIAAFLGGGAIVWFYNKMRRNKAADDAEKASEDSVKEDKDRDNVLSDIDEVIRRNEEIRDKIKKKLESS